MRDEIKKSTIIILAASMVSVLIILVAIISSGSLQQKLAIQSHAIIPNSDSDKTTDSSLEFGGGFGDSEGGGGSGGSSGGGSSGGSLTPLTSTSSGDGGGIILAGTESLPEFSNLWDDSGTLVESGTAHLNVSITGTNGNVGINLGGKNYNIDNNNWLDYDGSGDYVNYGNNPQFSPIKTGAISFYALITPANTTKTMSVISKQFNNPNSEYDLQFDASGNIVFYVYKLNLHNHCYVSTAGIEDSYVAGKTYFVYAEYINQTSCSLQIDGGDKLTSTVLDGTIGNVSANLKIGERDSGANDFQGSVDNFVFYNKTLNPIQVQRIYNENNLGESIPVISYHKIYNDNGAQEVVNKTNFAAQMKFLHDNGYHTITYKQWADWTNGIGTIPEKPIIITFDDDWYSVYLNAYPIMHDYGYVGVEAVITQWADDAFGEGEEEGAMTWDQLKDLSNHGWEIASHTNDHLDMLTLTVEQRASQFTDSKNKIQDNLNIEVSTFIYPFDSANIVTDAECGKYYSICSGNSQYPEHVGIEGDEDFFIFKSTNKIYSDGTPIGMRRVAIMNTATLADFKYYIDYYDGQQINCQFNENSGSIAYDSSGKGNNGAITGATWNNNLYYKEIFLNSPGTYPYYWWAYGTNNDYGFSDTRSYTVHATHIPNISLQITNPTTETPLSVLGGSDIPIYFNFLIDSTNVTSGVTINNVIIGEQPATILSNPIVETSHTYNASHINIETSDNIDQPPRWNDAWDGTPADSDCYTKTLTSDNAYCKVLVPGNSYSTRDREPWARFTFDIPENVNDITSIKITAEAKANSGSSDEDVAFIIANFATNHWTKFESDTRTEVTRTVTYTSGFSDIIENGQLVLLIEGERLDGGESIEIDHVEITVDASSGSGGYQFVYIPNVGWQVNVTTPSGLTGLQDLSVSATYNGIERSQTQINAINYGGECVVDADCNNTLFCDGEERCSNGACIVGISPPLVNDSLFCTNDYCDEESDTVVHTPISCAANDILEINICTNDPDNNPLTLDFRNIFTSTCNEDTDSCTIGNSTITHTCDVTTCGAQCDATHSCPATECNNLDECIGNDYYDYSNVSNACFGECTCESNACGDPVISYNDSKCTQCQTDNDCSNITKNFCVGTSIKRNESRCVNHACVIFTDIPIIDCNDGLFCNGQETCTTISPSNATCSSGTPVSCSANDIFGINTCTNIPDNNSLTLDFRNLFTSICNEDTDSCTIGNSTITHTCDVTTCGAECDATHSCADKCVGNVYYSGGNCNSCSCSYQTETCNTHDRWYNTTLQWVSLEACTEKQQVQQEYRSYGCGTGGCTAYSVISTKWVDTGITRNKDDGTSCSDGLYCNGEETCQSGACVSGTPVSCSGYNILGIATCNNDPDSLSFTWDSRAAFTSECNDNTDSCTSGSEAITHTCSVSQCGAQCDPTHQCPATECDDLDKCVGSDYYNYNDVANACLAGCTCETNVCGDPVISYNDSARGCYIPPICSINTNCGNNGYLNTPICQGNDVWQNFITYTCNNPGTSSSFCSDSTALKLKEDCPNECTEGRCKVKVCKTVCNYGTCNEYCVWQ